MLRALIKSTTERFPESKRLHANKVAERTVVESAYVEYSRLSLEAVHCTITALGRHLKEEDEVLTVIVHPNPSPGEVRDTLVHLCRGLLGVAIAANELVGFTSK